MKPDTICTREFSDARDEIQDESDDSKYQVCWSNAMDKGNYGKPSCYKYAHVLLLYWDESCGDLSTKQEVEDLRDVFEELFHYHTIIKKLTAPSPGKRLQTTLNAIVANFIEDCDGPDTLLVVYYAGHGRPGDQYGHLQLLGETSPNDKKNGVDIQTRLVMWNQTEKLLKAAAGDVLEIFDCCYARNLGLTRGESRLFEYLAATSEWNTTAIPGDKSFTSALIFSLNALVNEKEEGRFTTVELWKTIKDKAPHFPKDQEPILSDRERNTSAGRIMLHPLSETPVSPRPPLSPGVEGRTVTLVLDFSNKPSLEDIEKLGEEVNKIFEYHNLGVNRVRWGRMTRSASARSVQVFKSILNRNRRASGTTTLHGLLQAQADNDRASDDPDGSVSRDDNALEILTPWDTSAPSTASRPSPQMHTVVIDGHFHIETGRLPSLSISTALDSDDQLELD